MWTKRSYAAPERLSVALVLSEARRIFKRKKSPATTESISAPLVKVIVS